MNAINADVTAECSLLWPLISHCSTEYQYHLIWHLIKTCCAFPVTDLSHPMDYAQSQGVWLQIRHSDVFLEKMANSNEQD